MFINKIKYKIDQKKIFANDITVDYVSKPY